VLAFMTCSPMGGVLLLALPPEDRGGVVRPSPASYCGSRGSVCEYDLVVRVLGLGSALDITMVGPVLGFRSKVWI
jgi:hypothetical protein